MVISNILLSRLFAALIVKCFDSYFSMCIFQSYIVQGKHIYINKVLIDNVVYMYYN